ncbi:hypothetical protein QYE76_027438 [Lolium multiflorum]|uniref:Reverse transcriptase domain-containing protein n=1 Tax=Lolium multiflorum TaxID=4521 RepID=A0AAD8QJ53_LOLMU|nr:hypothetical protein QYE76_027438 [Lolium multiflorum]
MQHTGKCLQRWGRNIYSNTKVLLHAALLVILHFDMAQDVRQLFPEEVVFRARLKRKVIALAVVERARKRQSSRITNLKEGDANTKYFHLRVNARRRKNHMHRLKHNNGWVTGHEEKEKVDLDHFKSIMGRGDRGSHDFNWAELNFSTPDLHSPGTPITEEEVKVAITQMPGDKAPGPDGFTGLFFKRCWDIIKGDVMAVVHLFGNLHVHNFHWLNSANIVLLPKKEGAEEISDYRPISLIHAIAKILSKTLANRLGPLMDELVSNAQSAFIKKRSIHDNFIYVKNLATSYHRNKTPALLFKLDIRKAFDSSPPPQGCYSMGCPVYQLNMDVGFGKGTPSRLSFFILAIDTLAQILEKATTHGLLHKLKGRGNILRTSLYADDAAIFMAPIKEDIQNLTSILHDFGKVTGLSTNFLKTFVVPIRCGNLDLDDILHGIPAVRESFPLRYLGLPLTVRCLKRSDIQHLEDKCAGKLPTWNGKYITTAGRAALVKSVIASQAIYYLTPLSIPAGTIAFINKIERAFLWSAKDHTTGAKSPPDESTSTSFLPENFIRRHSKARIDPSCTRLNGERAPPPIFGLAGGQYAKFASSTFVGATGNHHTIAARNMSDRSPRFTDSSPINPPPNSAEPTFIEPLAFLPPNISDTRQAQPYSASSSNFHERIPTVEEIQAEREGQARMAAKVQEAEQKKASKARNREGEKGQWWPFDVTESELKAFEKEGLLAPVKKETKDKVMVMVNCGSMTFVLRTKRVFPPLAPHEFVWYWNDEWFYLKNVTIPVLHDGLPAFNNNPPKELASWSFIPNLS